MPGANPYHCGEWQNRTSDAFTSWKDAYAHRGDCQAPSGAACPNCDSEGTLSRHQRRLAAEVAVYAATDTTRSVAAAEELAAHVAVWGDRRLT